MKKKKSVSKIKRVNKYRNVEHDGVQYKAIPRCQWLILCDNYPNTCDKKIVTRMSVYFYLVICVVCSHSYLYYIDLLYGFIWCVICAIICHDAMPWTGWVYTTKLDTAHKTHINTLSDYNKEHRKRNGCWANNESEGKP